jgi:tRNA G10  N-methylase Trm11
MRVDKAAHPAKFSKQLIPVFAVELAGCHRVLDPFAGIGGIHVLREYGHETVGVELEPEWAEQHDGTIVADARWLPFPDAFFDAACSSPCYGNRMADHHEARDSSRRNTYRHLLGRPLTEGNSGALHWGDAYRNLHVAAWKELARVLKPGGLFVLNVKDHIRGGNRQHVAGWHVTTLCRMGFDLVRHKAIATPGHRMGANYDLRIDEEQVYVLKAPGGGQ